jgi:hypothetical protein
VFLRGWLKRFTPGPKEITMVELTEKELVDVRVKTTTGGIFQVPQVVPVVAKAFYESLIYPSRRSGGTTSLYALNGAVLAIQAKSVQSIFIVNLAGEETCVYDRDG